MRASIPATTDFIILSTGGRPVVSDTNFRKPISAVEFIPTPVAVISEFIRARNTILVSDTLDDSLRLL